MRKNKKSFLIHLMIAFLTAFLISGCGGGGGGSSQTDDAIDGGGGGGGGGDETTLTLNLTGEVYDDILADANVIFYVTDPNHPIARTSTLYNGTYQTQVEVDDDTQVLYTRAEGGRFANSGAEFNGILYGVASLKDAENDAGSTTGGDTQHKSLQVHLNPITSLLRSYLVKNPGISLDTALVLLQMKLQQIDANSPGIISSSDLSGFSSNAAQSAQNAALVRRISNLISYQVNQDDPNAGSIDRVIDRIAGGWLPQEASLSKYLALAAAADRGKGQLTGSVFDLDSQSPVAGATASIRGTAFKSQTDENGNFFFSQLPVGMDLIIDMKAPGYASTQTVAKISPEEKSQGVVVIMKAVVSRVKLDMEGGIVASSRARARYLDEGELEINAMDDAMSLTFSPKDLRRIRHTLSRRKSAFPARYAAEQEEPAIYVKITPLDPTKEIDAFPGDFTTSDPNAAGEEDEREKKLESVVLGEFTLEYEDGTPVNDIDLEDGVKIRFRLPDALQQMYRQSYNRGERSIPWYAYDPNDSTWDLSEQQAELILIDEVVYAVATATHFSWWNVDWPVTTHGCIHGRVYDRLHENGLAGVQIRAEGVDYQGQSFAMTDPNGDYVVTVKKNALTRITAQLGEYEVQDPNAVYVDQQKDENDENRDDCKRVDIDFHLVKICGRVVNSQNNSGIHGAYVYASTAGGKFTDPNGEFHLISAPNRKVKLKVSYTNNRINYHVGHNLWVGNEDIPCGDPNAIVSINLSPQYVRGTITIINDDGTQKTLTGKEVKITADTGFTTANDAQGNYQVVVERGTELVNISYRYYAQNGTYLEQRRTISWLDPNTQQGDDPNVTFRVQSVWLYGTVTDPASGDKPLPNIRISTTLGTFALSDPNTGEYELKVPAGTKFDAVARLAIPEAGIVEVDRKTVSTNISDSEQQVDFHLDSRVARITGRVMGNGKPLQDVAVVSEYGGRDLTGADGTYTLIVPANLNEVLVAFSCDRDRDKYKPAFRTFSTPERGLTETVADVNLEVNNFRPIIRKVDILPGLKVCWTDPNSTKVTLNITAIDPDDDPLTYTVIVKALPPLIMQDKTLSPADSPSRFSWKVPQLGKYSMTVSVSDGKDNGTASISLVVEAVSCETQNEAPVILLMTPSKAITGIPGGTQSFSVVAYDPDGDPLSLHYTWKIIDPNARAVSDSEWSLTYPNGQNASLIIPADLFEGDEFDANKPAEFTVRVTVTDSGGKKAEKGVSLTVLANRAPVVTSIGVVPGQCILADTVKLTAKAVDPDDPAGIYPLTYTWSCRGVTIGTGPALSWTVPDNPVYVGTQDIMVTVQDTYAAQPRSSSKTVPLLVAANNAPQITSLTATKKSVLPNEQISIQAVVTDPEGRQISYAWSCTGGTIPSGQGTSQITWKAPQNTGDYTISLKVSDGLRETTGTIDIRVASLTVDAGENQVLYLEDMGNPPTAALSAQIGINPADEPYTINWRIDPNSIETGANASLDSSSTQNTVFSADTAGSYHIWLTVTVNANSTITGKDDVWIYVLEQAPPAVTGTVRDEDGNPVSGAAVEMYHADGPEVWDQKTVTNENGYYEFFDVPPGTYYVIVNRDNYLGLTQTVTIPAE
ncbi:MAG: carboxypeptidase regulatory-like domain-containing protein [bacterium]